jgi:membrane fusion protein, multidrug efflux system
MDQMIDHSTIEGTSIERAGELRRRRPTSRTWLVGAAAALALLLTYLGSSYYRNGQATAPQAAVPSVTVSRPLQRDIDTRLGFLGQFSAIDRVELRAQVGGTLTEIHFQDGQIVHKGDLLFVIDPRPYEIKLAEAPQNTSPSSSLLRSVSGYGLMSPRPGQVSRSANPLALLNRRRPSSAERLL